MPEIKKDCFGYDRICKKCRVLTETLCAHKECTFYKTKEQFDKDRKKYPMGGKF